MLAIAKALMLAFVVTGASATAVATGVLHVPMTKSIEVIKSHLDPNSTLPQQAMNGQQNAYNHLVENQNRWLAANHTTEPDNDAADLG